MKKVCGGQISKFFQDSFFVIPLNVVVDDCHEVILRIQVADHCDADRYIRFVFACSRFFEIFVAKPLDELVDRVFY